MMRYVASTSPHARSTKDTAPSVSMCWKHVPISKNPSLVGGAAAHHENAALPNFLVWLATGPPCSGAGQAMVSPSATAVTRSNAWAVLHSTTGCAEPSVVTRPRHWPTRYAGSGPGASVPGGAEPAGVSDVV